MNAVTLAPVQWSNLKNIDDVSPLNDEDAACLAELREVLKKHAGLDRFGVALLHSHFDLAPDEIMLETTDAENRCLTTKPVKVDEAGTNNVGTIWMLRDGAGDVITTWCRAYCRRIKGGTAHTPDHVKNG